MRKLWASLAVLLCAAVVGTAVMSPKSIDRVYMSSESDGRHQDDHKVLGFIPYSSTKPDPSLRITDDTFRSLREAGIENLPQARRTDPVRPPTRLIYPDGTYYCFGFGLGKTQPKDAVDFYAKQLKGPTRRSSAVEESVEGVCPDGKTRLYFTIIPGTHDASLRFGRDRKP